MNAPGSSPLGFNHSLWNKPITHIPAHNTCSTAPALRRSAAASSSSSGTQQSQQSHPSDCYTRGGVQRPSLSTIPTPLSSATNSAHHTPTHSLSLAPPATLHAASTTHSLVPPPPPARLLQPSSAVGTASHLRPATETSASTAASAPTATATAATTVTTAGPPQPQPAGSAEKQHRPARRVVRVESTGWTVESEPYIVMEPREVTVMRQRSVPGVQHTLHTQWQTVDKQRLQPVVPSMPLAAMREDSSHEETGPESEEKEQLSTQPPTATSGGQQQEAEEGEAVTELGARVRAVFGRHSSSGGLLVTGLSERGECRRAGVLVGDVLMAVDGGEGAQRGTAAGAVGGQCGSAVSSRGAARPTPSHADSQCAAVTWSEIHMAATACNSLSRAVRRRQDQESVCGTGWAAVCHTSQDSIDGSM